MPRSITIPPDALMCGATGAQRGACVHPESQEGPVLQRLLVLSVRQLETARFVDDTQKHSGVAALLEQVVLADGVEPCRPRVRFENAWRDDVSSNIFCRADPRPDEVGLVRESR